MTTQGSLHPPVMWAQGKQSVYLTFNVESKDPTVKIESKSVYFKAIGEPEKQNYDVTIPLFAEIVPDQSKTTNKGRCIEVLLAKENTNAPFWATLTNDKVKHHWLKVNFNKMEDEAESEDEAAKSSVNLEEMMRSMGGLDDMNEKPSFDDVATDSDDEDLPDLE